MQLPYGRFVVFLGPAVTMAYSDDGTVMLQLLNTVVEQSGEYICTASNESGVATSTAILTVTGKGVLRGSCTAEVEFEFST